VTTSIPLAAFVAPSEQAAVEAARDHLLRALGSTGGAWSIDCDFAEAIGDLTAAPAGAVLLTSLLPEADGDEAWGDTEARLRGIHADLSERGDPVFICTVLRHAGEGDREAALRRRVRIRRLNALAAELSREFGAFVIDIDRVLADIGAGRLGTDYRLQGAAAADLAGKAMAIDIVVNGLDAFAAFDVQDAARAYLAQYQTIVALPTEIKPQNLMALGQGRRKQVAATITNNDQQGHVGWLVQQALKGKIGPAEAFGKLAQAVRRRGARESFSMLANALFKMGKRA
jgi:hypothetical protein